MDVVGAGDHMTDEDIAKSVQRGDRESLGLLVERYEEKLRRYGKKFLANASDIEDMVQDVFVKAYLNIQDFDTSRKFSSWIYRIAHNEFVNAIKKVSRLPIPFFDFDTLFPHLRAPETADRDAELREIGELLERHLASIDPKYREPLVLYYIEDLGYEEIAEILRIPVSTVGVRLNRAKLLLKKSYVKR